MPQLASTGSSTRRNFCGRSASEPLYKAPKSIILMAESKKELESVCETVETIGKRNSSTIDAHYLKRREALNTALPTGVRHVETMRTLLTQSLAVLMPFNVQELNDSTGNYCRPLCEKTVYRHCKE